MEWGIKSEFYVHCYVPSSFLYKRFQEQTATGCSQTAADPEQFNYTESSEHSIFLPGKRSDLTQCLSVAFLYYRLFAQVTMEAQRKGKNI